ncbi:hypothetical protein [Conexibacter sp. DBS9H8]|uniref:hypothetical protein n=1 Tax=Conexibacter sp. DBS9H8 TaxID=2937801 RepID=UPI00200D4E5C|nr:hypothetical protein [Conexibacter sp. DBS9H8]
MRGPAGLVRAVVSGFVILAAVVLLCASGLLASARPARAGTGARTPRTDGAGVRRPGRVGAGPVADHLAAPVPPPPGTWTAPRIALGPVTAALIAPQISVDAAGDWVDASGTTAANAPAAARAAIAEGGPDPRTPIHSVSLVAQQVLSAGLEGRRLVLLAGTSPAGAGTGCCSSAELGAGTVTAPGALRPVLSGLEGPTTAALVPVRGGWLIGVDNQAGITALVSRTGAGVTASKLLAGSNPTPGLMAAGPWPGGGAVIVWTAPDTAAATVTGTTTTPSPGGAAAGTSTAASGYDQPADGRIEFALAGVGRLPGAPRLAVSVPPGREIDALTVTPSATGALIAWTESWFAGARYRSAVFWASLARGARAHLLSSPATAAVGVSLAGQPRRPELVAWQACRVGPGTCTTDAALWRRGGGWGHVRVLGPDDPTGFPVASAATDGNALVGWIAGGRVRVAVHRATSSGFSTAATISRGSGASALALRFGAGPEAVAAWVQGTDRERLMSALWEP